MPDATLLLFLGTHWKQWNGIHKAADTCLPLHDSALMDSAMVM